MRRLLLDPAGVLRDALGRADAKRMPLAQLVTELLCWLEQPMPWRQLLEVLADVLEISDRRESIEHSREASTVVPNEFIDPAPTPVEAAKWEEYLRWLWQESARLSLPQRTAFLLHAPVLREFELCGIGSIRQSAVLLEMPAETLAELWKEIPLGDLAIGQSLGRTRQQVINLRRLARDRLAAAWKEWIK